MSDTLPPVAVTIGEHRWHSKFGENSASHVLLAERGHDLRRAGTRYHFTGSDGSPVWVCSDENELAADEIGLIVPGSRLHDGRFLPGPLTGYVFNGRPPTPASVIESYEGAFTFVQEDRIKDRAGLRPAQLGAVHAALAHWTSGSIEPATIVMPTGTGKTDTMVALVVAALIPKLLVLVPSDALRTQIAEKFLCFGICQAATAVSWSAVRPIVGLIRSGQTSVEQMAELLDRSTVVIATPQALGHCDDDVRGLVAERCSHLFVDEAHHVTAESWQSVVRSFGQKPVLQFTATPYREDKHRLGGRPIYTYPLRLAQEAGVFSRINYVAVQSIAEPDRRIAERAVLALDQDLRRGFDHLLMARVKSVTRASQMFELYRNVAPRHNPVLIHSGLPPTEQTAAVQAMRDRSSRIIVCVDMLGEGFDLPELKIAAIHDPHKSLGITLQFVGRFARPVDNPEQAATVVVPRPEGQYDPILQDLFAEDADWNEIIRELSEIPSRRDEEVQEFESGFGTNLTDIAIRSLSPSMSAVVFNTGDATVEFHRVVNHFGNDNLVGGTASVNADRAVGWFIVRRSEPVGFGRIEGLLNSWFELFVVYWDRDRRLLYVHGSANAGRYEWLSEVLCGRQLPLVTGETVYRVMAHLARPEATNMGVLDAIDRARKFTMVNGEGVTEGFSDVEARGKVQTNIFAQGFVDGRSAGYGASLKGRIWSHRNASVLLEWVEWCDLVGDALTDETISVDEVLRRFLRPKSVTTLPTDIPLAIDWNYQEPLFYQTRAKIVWDDQSDGFDDVDLKIVDHEPQDTLLFDIIVSGQARRYTLGIRESRMTVTPLGEDFTLRRGRREDPLSEVLTEKGLVVYYSDEGILLPPNLYAKPASTHPVLSMERLVALDWTGTDLRVESRGIPPRADSIQERMARVLLEDDSWQVIFDDDRTGEAADLVAIKVENEELVVGLVHCKYSSEDRPGARAGDLYEVCGQALRSGTWSERSSRLYDHLRSRMSNNFAKTGQYGLIKGTEKDFLDLCDQSRRTRTHIRVAIAQPGLSKGKLDTSEARIKLIELLAGTEHYVRSKTGSSLTVYCSP